MINHYDGLLNKCVVTIDCVLDASFLQTFIFCILLNAKMFTSQFLLFFTIKVFVIKLSKYGYVG